MHLSVSRFPSICFLWAVVLAVSATSSFHVVSQSWGYETGSSRLETVSQGGHSATYSYDPNSIAKKIFIVADENGQTRYYDASSKCWKKIGLDLVENALAADAKGLEQFIAAQNGYWTATKPKGPLQSVIDSALDQNWGNSATTVIRAQVPAGTRIYEGAAAAQRGLVGGGNQIYIPKVDPKWITP